MRSVPDTAAAGMESRRTARIASLAIMSGSRRERERAFGQVDRRRSVTHLM
jgi:hypothetical protein